MSPAVLVQVRSGDESPMQEFAKTGWNPPPYSSIPILSLIGTDWESETFANSSIENSSAVVLNNFLRQLIEHSQKGAAHMIKKCVITVPACFTSEKRRLLRELVEEAGLEVFDIRRRKSRMERLWRR